MAAGNFATFAQVVSEVSKSIISTSFVSPDDVDPPTTRSLVKPEIQIRNTWNGSEVGIVHVFFASNVCFKKKI